MPRVLEDYERGFVRTDELEEPQVSQLIGEMAERAQAWIPLCPQYPNLKGVTCEPIEDLIEAIDRAHYDCTPLRLEYADRLEKVLEGRDIEELKVFMENQSQTFKDWWHTFKLYTLDKYDDDEVPYYYTSLLEGHYKTSSVEWPADLKKDWKKMRPIDHYLIQAYNHAPEIIPEFYSPTYNPDFVRYYMVVALDDQLRALQDRASTMRFMDAPCLVGFNMRGGDPRLQALDSQIREECESQTEAWKDFNERDLLHAVKVFERDELYDLARELGNKLTGGIDLELSLYKKWLRSNYSTNVLEQGDAAVRRAMLTDARWRQQKQNSNFDSDLHRHAQDLGVKDLLHDKSTIFVTTPRGGYEFLSIFMYANDIDKAQVPAFYTELTEFDSYPGAADIEGELEGWMVGTTWLNNRSHPIKTVVIIDDVVESGEQQSHAHKNLRTFFGNKVDVITITACGRRIPELIFYNKLYNPETNEWHDFDPTDEGNMPIPIEDAEKPWVNIFDQAIYGFEMLDLENWRKAQDAKKPDAPNKLCACGFPWSFTDSTPSRYLRTIYGTRSERGAYRPPREKRKA